MPVNYWCGAILSDIGTKTQREAQYLDFLPVANTKRVNMEAPMTVNELAEYLKLDSTTLYKMLKEEKIPASRIGHQMEVFSRGH